MKRLLRYLILSVALSFTADSIVAQTADWRAMHQVKKKETIFGIAREYGITIEELINANPEMKMPGYELRKGDVIRIPQPSKRTEKANQTAATPATDATASGSNANPQPTPVAKPTPQVPADDVRNRAIRLGIMLPLHDINGDGRRMVEYYRGVLLACDSLKRQGISVDIHAWNTAEDSDISQVLKDPAAQRCDLIIGPLYSKQMQLLSDFVAKHDIRLVIPFSIDAPQLNTNRNIFQVFQPQTAIYEATIARFLDRFADAHPVIIDCNDTTSRKGDFTFKLRAQLEGRNIAYAITNLKSSDANFAKNFSTDKRNVVILNTGRSPELNVAVAKLNNLAMNRPDINITLFGYTEWLLYTKHQLENFYKFDTYIPATFYLNPLSTQTARIEHKYRSSFHSEMMVAMPRFAVTGFDHAYFFLKGLHKYGKTFNGAAGMFGYQPIQTPLAFERVGNGGLQNRTLLFVHYSPEHRIETLKK